MQTKICWQSCFATSSLTGGHSSQRPLAALTVQVPVERKRKVHAFSFLRSSAIFSNHNGSLLRRQPGAHVTVLVRWNACVHSATPQTDSTGGSYDMQHQIYQYIGRRLRSKVAQCEGWESVVCIKTLDSSIMRSLHLNTCLWECNNVLGQMQQKLYIHCIWLKLLIWHAVTHALSWQRLTVRS